MLAGEKKMEFDEGGKIAESGKINRELLEKLNSLSYYSAQFPKSLPNSFGTDLVYPMIRNFNLEIEEAMATYAEHICLQIKNSLQPFFSNSEIQKLMITGGGAFNSFLIQTT